jgi:LPPG:FO 2-phospho-L-lactate transferase
METAVPQPGPAPARRKVVALSGGIGGAKLALGLSRILPPGDLTVIANTGDDFRHLGLAISPDIDTLTYVLAGLDDPERGWGRRDETWTFMAALRSLGGADWFQLGDGDLALHVERTRRLAAGEPLSAVTAAITDRLGIATRILPMTDQPVATRLLTGEGWMDFQPWFVGRRAEPAVRAVAFAGAEAARPAPGVVEALAADDLAAVVICPSNPFVSIDPILAVPGLREAIAGARAPVVAVTPIIGGAAVKGPTAKMMREFGGESSAAAVAARYAGLADVFVGDVVDGAIATPAGMALVTAETLMLSLADRERLATTVLEAAGRAAA